MNRKLTDQQILAVCLELAQVQRHVSVRQVMATLRARHAATGRTARVSHLLDGVLNAALPPAASNTDVSILQEKLRLAEDRAARAEYLERAHQDFWARRYDEKLQELERRTMTQSQAKPGAK